VKITHDRSLKTIEATFRRQIIFILRQRPATLHDLAFELDLKEKDAAEHLTHARKSLNKNERLVIEPSACAKCGYLFKNRSRFGEPSRCPLCKCERIYPAVFKIKAA